MAPYTSLLFGGEMGLVPAWGRGVTPGCLAEAADEKQGDVLLCCRPIQVRTDALPGTEQSSLGSGSKSPQETQNPRS